MYVRVYQEQNWVDLLQWRLSMNCVESRQRGIQHQMHLENRLIMINVGQDYVDM